MCVTNYSQMYQCIYCNYIYIGCRCIKSIDYWNWVCTLIPVIPICLLHSLLWPSMRIRLLKCPSLVVVGHLNIWNPGGDLGVPAFLHRLTAASDLETSVVGTGGWIRDESSWAKGGWSWPQITWSHLILKGLLTSVDRLKKIASQHISTVLVTKLSWGMWRQFFYRCFVAFPHLWVVKNSCFTLW